MSFPILWESGRCRDFSGRSKIHRAWHTRMKKVVHVVKLESKRLYSKSYVVCIPSKQKRKKKRYRTSGE